jgi:hypothetical protein
VTGWSDKKILELLKMVATSIDFDQLFADGVLRKHGAKYELLDLAWLPEHARRKICIIASSKKTPNPVVSFQKIRKQTVQHAKKRGLLPPE